LKLYQINKDLKEAEEEVLGVVAEVLEVVEEEAVH